MKNTLAYELSDRIKRQETLKRGKTPAPAVKVSRNGGKQTYWITLRDGPFFRTDFSIRTTLGLVH